jgi:DNA-3-methyladenine glycosylase II
MTTQLPFAAVVAAATSHLSNIDPVMRITIEQIGPCTLKPDPDIFNSLVDAIISQQISIKAANAILARVRAAMPGGVITPEVLAGYNSDTLRPLGLSAQKARYILSLVEHIQNGQLVLEELPILGDEEIIQRLTMVKGVGRWTAEMVLIFTLGRADVLPVDDLGFLEGVRAAYDLPDRPKRAEMLARGELWRPYRTFATWYMWKRHERRNSFQGSKIVEHSRYILEEGPA